MQERVLYTYALAKSLHENGSYVLDVFVPFILKVLADHGGVLKQGEVKESLKEEFCLQIPRYTIGTIVNRAKRKGYLEQEKEKLYLTAKGERAQSKVNIRDAARDENKFVVGLQEYLLKRDINWIKKEVAAKLESVINSNLCSLLTYLGEEPHFGECDQLNKKESREIINFFKEIELSNNDLFNILKSIIMGSIICTMVKKDHKTLKTKLRPAKIFLDTNVTFSLLGFDHPDISTPVKELISLLKSNGYRLYVFPFTVEESIRVLNNYKKHYRKYNSTVKVNSIYNRLRHLGHTPSDMTEIIANIEEILKEQGIEIYPLSSKELEITEQAYRKLRKYKGKSNHFSIEHDLYAIEAIKKLRGKEVRKLEKADALFLSSDQKLTKYNFSDCGHKMNATINEVILDQLMTNLLWLKNPNLSSRLPLQSVMSLHADKLFIHNDVWRKFQSVVQKMKKANMISEDELSIMLYNDNIEEILLNYEGKIDDIDEIYVEDLIAKSKKFYKEQENTLNLQREENLRLSEEKEQVLDYINELTTNLCKSASRKANRWANIVSYFCLPILVLLITILLLSLLPSSSDDIIKMFLSVLSLVISLGIIPKINMKEKIRICLNSYFTKRLKNMYFPDNKIGLCHEFSILEAASSQQEKEYG